MNDTEETQKCLQCGATSNESVLLSCVREGEQAWVCVGCLPILIHGSH